MARFVPFVRTFAPFDAGVAAMKYRTFVLFDLLGGALWIGSMLLAGYLLGEVVQEPSNESLLATRKVLWLVKEAERQEFLDQVKGTSAFENPRTVIQTAINHHDVRKYVEKKTASNFWQLLGNAGINSWVFQSNPSKWSLLDAIEKNVNTFFIF